MRKVLYFIQHIAFGMFFVLLANLLLPLNFEFESVKGTYSGKFDTSHIYNIGK